MTIQELFYALCFQMVHLQDHDEQGWLYEHLRTLANNTNPSDAKYEVLRCFAGAYEDALREAGMQYKVKTEFPEIASRIYTAEELEALMRQAEGKDQ